MKARTFAIVFLLLLATLTAVRIPLYCQTNSFTYQGKLTDGGAPANGTYQMSFKLYDNNGNQIGSTISDVSTTVTNGIFTVQLDFGATAFSSGGDRYLEIYVRHNPADAYARLSPQQPITSVPYAVRSQSSANADTATNAAQLGGVAANQYVITTDMRLSDARPPTEGSELYIQNNTTVQRQSNFNISGTGAANIFDAGAQFNIGGIRVLSVSGSASFSNTDTFVGVGTGASNTPGVPNPDSGTLNSFFGYNAGNANTVGRYNSFFGYKAGQSNTIGVSNSFFGTQAGLTNTQGISNSFFGVGAGQSNTSGSSNSFFGQSAGLANTVGANNTFIGIGAGQTNTNGSNVTIVGASGGVGADNLSYATAIGADAIVNANNTIVLGRSSGQETVQVPGNLIVTGTLTANLPAGNGNYIQNTTTQQNSSNFNISGNGTVGGTFSASYLNATNAYRVGGNRILNAPGVNLFVGLNAGPVGSASGTFNSFFGTDSGTNINTGSENSFFGAGSGYENSSGNYNSYFGISAGRYNSSGSGNTHIGYLAGVNAYGGNYNSSLGFSTSVGDINLYLTNATAVGSRASVTQSNSLVLGSINGINGCTSANSCDSVKVGIGTTAPAATLDLLPAGVTKHILLGNPNCGAGYAAIGFGTSFDSGCTNYSVLGDGISTYVNRPSGGSLFFREANSSSQLTIVGGGNIGIGTTSPSAKVSIVSSGSSELAGSAASATFRTTAGTLGTSLGDELPLASFGFLAQGNNVSLGIRATRNAFASGWNTTAIGLGMDVDNTVRASGGSLWIDANGNVGIGISNPGSKLDVNGVIGVGALGTAGATQLCRNSLQEISTCSSSLRYKTNVASLRLGLNLLDRLRPISFNWRQGGAADIGLGAEDVARIEPRLVTYNDKGEVEGVKYDRLTVVLVNAAKEQQAEIESLKKQIEEQKTQQQEKDKLTAQQFGALKSLICRRNRQAAVCR